jgi:hypothetical protein
MRTAGPANAVCARSAWCAIACAFGLAHIAFAKAPCFQTDEEPLVIGIIQSFLTCFELAGTKYVDLLSKNYYYL